MAYTPSQHTTSNKPYAVSGMPDGARTYFYDSGHFKYRAFVDTTEVLSYFNTPSKRAGQFPIIVNTGGTLLNGVITGGTNLEYWFKDGVLDGDLQVKSFYGADFVPYTGATNDVNLGDHTLDMGVSGSKNAIGVNSVNGSAAILNSNNGIALKVSVDNIDSSNSDVAQFIGQLGTARVRYDGKISSEGYIIEGGGSPTQFLKSDGSVDSTTYLSSLTGIAAGGQLSGTYPNPTLLNSAVIAKVLTGYTSGAGTISASDTLLSAIQKLNGNLTSRTLTINGSAQTLAADRTWTIAVTGTNNKIDVSGGSGLAPTLTISPTYVGQTSITTLGTIATGVWSGTAVAATKGGTGLTALGTANQLLRINAGGTALEYFTPTYVALDTLSATSPLLYDNTTGVFSIQAAGAAQSGYVTTGTQSFVGDKTFIGNTATASLQTTSSGGVSALDGAVAVFKDGSNTAGFGGSYILAESVGTGNHSWLEQLNASYGIDWWFAPDGATYVKHMSLSNAGVLSLLTAPLALSSGGTGSTTQNFVDLTTTQSVGGAKTFSSIITGTAGIQTSSSTALTSTNVGTSGNNITLWNTGGQLFFGADNSTGAITSSNYGSYIVFPSTRSFSIIRNGVGTAYNINSSGLHSFTGAITTNSTLDVGGNLLPTTNAAYELGNASKKWASGNIFILTVQGIHHPYQVIGNGTGVANHAGGVITFNGSTSLGYIAMAPVAGYEGMTATVVNRGTAYIELRGNGLASELWLGGTVYSTYNVAPGTTYTLFNDGVYWCVTGVKNAKRVVAITSSAVPAINTDLCDVFKITALSASITDMTSSLTGSPTDGQFLRIEITSTATRGIVWGASYESSGTVPLPSTTVGTTRLDIGFVWNTVTSKWRCIAVA